MAAFLKFPAFILSIVAFYGIGSEADCTLILNPSSSIISVFLGGDGKITCSFSADCELGGKMVINPYWEKIDHANNDRVFINSNPTAATLLYNDIQGENMGEYQCHALVGDQELITTVFLEAKTTAEEFGY